MSLLRDPNTDIWAFYEFLKIQSLAYNDTMIMSLIVSLVDITFNIQFYYIHIVPMLNTAWYKTQQIELKGFYLAITDSENFYTQTQEMDKMKCLVSK